MGEHDVILQYIPKNADPKNTSRVYFACHPEDHHTYLDEVADQLLSVGLSGGSTITLWHRNAASLSANQSAALIEQLSSMQLFVVAVTPRLLQDPGSCLDLEVAYAKAHHIPILPLLWDPALVTAYSRPENFGDLQFLNPAENDATALPYRQKLSEYLCSVLVGDQLRQQVREAFDTYIFLSYRKKDRKAAQEIMKLIHQNDFCRDVAIWYDEFLTPGENFSQAIRDALEKSRLFVLVVTPNITEPHNYVVDHEYPMAKQTGKEILPLESLQTDRERLLSSFDGLPEITDAHDASQLAQALLEKLGLETDRKVDTPEQRYLMGLAYLNGIDVEVDAKKSEALLLSAAQEDHHLAMITLANMYQNGKGVPRDYEKALHWMENACGVYIRLHQQDPETHRIALVNLLSRTSSAFFRLEQYTSAIKYAREAIMYCTLGFRATGDTAFISSALSQYFIKIPSQLQLSLKDDTDVDIQQIQKQSFPLFLEAEQFLNACGISWEQTLSLGQYAYMLYTQLSMLCASLGMSEEAQEYSRKMRAFTGESSEITALNQEMFAAINDETLDLPQWMAILRRLLDIYQAELEETPPSGKNAYLVSVLAAAESIIPQFCHFIEAYDYDEDDIDMDLAEEILDRFAAFLSLIEIDKMDPSELCSFATIFGAMVDFKSVREKPETALAYNRLQMDAARRSFEYYPTEKSLRQWMLAVDGLDELYPDENRHIELWLSLEQSADALYRTMIQTPSGYDTLDLLYEALTICHEETQDLAQAEHYAYKRAQALRHKFRRTQALSDELEAMEAEYEYCNYQRQNKRFHIDTPLKRLIQRFRELLKVQDQLQLNQKSYDKLIITFCNTLFLIYQVLADDQRTIEGYPYLEEFARIACQKHYADHFFDQLEQAKQILRYHPNRS